MIAAYYRESNQRMKFDLDDTASVPVGTHTETLLKPQLWRGQQNGFGPRNGAVHARHMRPMCERASSCKWGDKPVIQSQDQDVANKSQLFRVGDLSPAIILSCL